MQTNVVYKGFTWQNSVKNEINTSIHLENN